MLAGVGPCPAVMIVVAADEGWQAQSAEHLAALDALGVRHGLAVITRADLANPEPALRQAHGHLEKTSLAGIDSVVVSGRTRQGFSELEAGRLTAALPETDTEGAVRLWIDRVFTVTGAGTVVTGTLTRGTLRVGDELDAGGRQVRVRGLQTLGEKAEQVSATARVAINLRGVDRRRVGRGGRRRRAGASLDGTAEIDVALRFQPASFTASSCSPWVRGGFRSTSDHWARPPRGCAWRDRCRCAWGRRCCAVPSRTPRRRRDRGALSMDPAAASVSRPGAARARAKELASRSARPPVLRTPMTCAPWVLRDRRARGPGRRPAMVGRAASTMMTSHQDDQASDHDVEAGMSLEAPAQQAGLPAMELPAPVSS